MKTRFLALFCAAALSTVPHLAAAQQADDPTLVSLFLETCTGEDLNAEAIVAAIPEDWTELQAPNIDVAALAQVPSQAIPTSAFRRSESVRQWQRMWNGRQVSLVVATFPTGTPHRNVCAIIVPDIRNAGAHITPLREAMAPIGLTARSTDLPHYQEYGGRLRDMRRARAEVFSRSRTIPHGRNTMHMYIGFD